MRYSNQRVHGWLQLLKIKAFTIIYRQKVAASKDGYVYANKQHGRPTRLMHIPIAAAGSSTASNSCIRKRSQVVEKVLSDISGPAKNHSLPSDKVTQNASLINRNREMFVESAKEAGIKLVSKFDVKMSLLSRQNYLGNRSAC